MHNSCDLTVPGQIQMHNLAPIGSVTLHIKYSSYLVITYFVTVFVSHGAYMVVVLCVIEVVCERVVWNKISYLFVEVVCRVGVVFHCVVESEWNKMVRLFVEVCGGCLS